jgi:hypothetical protein
MYFYPKITVKKIKSVEDVTILKNAYKISEQFGISVDDLAEIIQNKIFSPYKILNKKEHTVIYKVITVDNLKKSLCSFLRSIKKEKMIFKMMNLDITVDTLVVPKSSSGNGIEITVIESIKDILNLLRVKFEWFSENFGKFINCQIEIFRKPEVIYFIGEYSQETIYNCIKDLPIIDKSQYIPKISHGLETTLTIYENPTIICKILNLTLEKLVEKFTNSGIEATWQSNEISINSPNFSIEQIKDIIFKE